MEFKEGGDWLYVMAGPEGEEHWCRADFKSVSPMKSFEGIDAFCDPLEKINTDFPVVHWYLNFSEAKNKTTVSVEIAFDSLTDLEKYIEMGFKEGFTMALGNLDELLS